MTWKRFLLYWPFVRRIWRPPVVSPHIRNACYEPLRYITRFQFQKSVAGISCMPHVLFIRLSYVTFPYKHNGQSNHRTVVHSFLWKLQWFDENHIKLFGRVFTLGCVASSIIPLDIGGIIQLEWRKITTTVLHNLFIVTSCLTGLKLNIHSGYSSLVETLLNVYLLCLCYPSWGVLCQKQVSVAETNNYIPQIPCSWYQGPDSI